MGHDVLVLPASSRPAVVPPASRAHISPCLSSARRPCPPLSSDMAMRALVRARDWHAAASRVRWRAW
ncbi:hypothetical protein EON67_01530 [archaeon]|nr:MAG: hypothetical protein EON67_01530 [archaeon]